MQYISYNDINVRRTLMCGCNKNSLRQNRSFRPVTGPRPAQGGVAAGASPAQIRALNAQSATGPRQIERMDSQRRRIEQIRRIAIKRKLGS